MDLLPNSAPLATKLRNTLIRYHGIGESEWRVAKRTVSGGLGRCLRADRSVLSRSCRSLGGGGRRGVLQFIMPYDTGVKNEANSCRTFM